MYQDPLSESNKKSTSQLLKGNVILSVFPLRPAQCVACLQASSPPGGKVLIGDKRWSLPCASF